MALRLDELKPPCVDFGNGVVISFDQEEYTDESAKQTAAKELRETPEVVSAAIQELRELIRQEKGLHLPLENESLLVRFLRPKKYYSDSAFEMMKAFYKMKSRENFILDRLSTESIRNALEDRVVQILPKHDQHGRRIVFMEMGAKWNCSKVPSLEVIRATNMLMEAIGREPRTQLHGIVFIINFDKLSLSHIGQFPPKFVKTIVDHGQKNSPYRIKGIHIVNNARMFNIMFKIFKPFLGKKWSQRIFLHGVDLKSLHEHIDASCLPSFLGGTYELPEYEGAVVGQLLDCYKDKLDEEDKYGYVQDS
ncbi:retinaldehyde-binding protein 1-like [Anopheles ziemanni]|uniref:retinaldehyde-binding protein 1-like n=1 Tax=Anopheles coustani TaxID=139045 RepID=UPI002658CC71|nr:retinaldehyde-binding protein 1-like [Anopheles coustani]XP_058167423.1 retinaldehyde-binding protein 1-like [Anopheles ziemanni]